MNRSTWQWDVLIDILINPKDHIIGWWGRFVFHFDTSNGPTSIWLQHGYRLLNIGELVQPGDEFLQHNCAESGLWLKAGPQKVGMLIRNEACTYRRRINPLQKEKGDLVCCFDPAGGLDKGCRAIARALPNGSFEILKILPEENKS